MGDRYYISLKCCKCDGQNPKVYYAPSCCFCTFKCVSCGYENGIAMNFIAVEKEQAQCDCGGECLEEK